MALQVEGSVISRRAPGGGWLRVSGIEQAELLGGFGFAAWAHTPQGSIRFSTATAGSFESIQRTLGEDTKPIGEASVRASQVRAYASSSGGVHYLWTGAFSEVSFYVSSPYVGMDLVVDGLTPFEVSESPEGAAVIARPGLGGRIDELGAYGSTRSGLGLNVYPLSRDARAEVGNRPRLTVERNTADGADRAVLVSETCLAEVRFQPDDERAANELAHRIGFTWEGSNG